MEIILFNFYALVRTASPQLTWTFYLITTNKDLWTESLLSTKGMPNKTVTSIFVCISCPYSRRFCSGFFTTDRTLEPRKTLQNVVSQSNLLVTDVLSEFAQRLRQPQ